MNLRCSELAQGDPNARGAETIVAWWKWCVAAGKERPSRQSNFGSSFIKNNSLWPVWLSATHGDKIR